MRSDSAQATLARTIVTRLSPEGLVRLEKWLRGGDLNPRPLGYEPNELPDCSTPRHGMRRKSPNVGCDGTLANLSDVQADP
jgi:hypothetical protein